MIELLDTLPDINVDPAEYKRLLGYPKLRALDGRARELADEARAWYAAHGKPWVYAREVANVSVSGNAVQIGGLQFVSKTLGNMLQKADAHGAILVAVSAGPEIEAEAKKAWEEEKPDEYFFLEMFGSAIVEHLTTQAGARLCAWAESHGQAVLPHYSPGYPEWDISQQRQLFNLIRQNKTDGPLSMLEVLESGMLRPKKSLLAVFGLTHHIDRVRRITDLIPCESCSFSPCQYRRTPYRRAREDGMAEVSTERDSDARDETFIAPAAPLDHAAIYSVNPKALKRWADERLTLTENNDGTIDALFVYEGTTCSNMGRAIQFHYHVKLSSRDDKYIIRDMLCGPSPTDEGHRYMCRYMTNAEHLMVAIDHEKPLLGQPLNNLLTWDRPKMGAGCYCEPNSRKHKWGLVLETIHFALVQRFK